MATPEKKHIVILMEDVIVKMGTKKMAGPAESVSMDFCLLFCKDGLMLWLSGTTGSVLHSHLLD